MLLTGCSVNSSDVTEVTVIAGARIPFEIAFSMSATTILPLGPVPVIFIISTPLSEANFLALGEILILSSSEIPGEISTSVLTGTDDVFSSDSSASAAISFSGRELLPG